MACHMLGNTIKGEKKNHCVSEESKELSKLGEVGLLNFFLICSCCYDYFTVFKCTVQWH